MDSVALGGFRGPFTEPPYNSSVKDDYESFVQIRKLRQKSERHGCWNQRAQSQILAVTKELCDFRQKIYLSEPWFPPRGNEDKGHQFLK